MQWLFARAPCHTSTGFPDHLAGTVQRFFQFFLAILPLLYFWILRQFRSSAFLPHLLNWAPSIPAEEDYLRFVQATGFNYETDLDLVAISFTHDGSNSSTTFAVAQGRFDRKKIEAYAGQRVNA